MAIPRDPPSHVKKILRNEVGFGCPSPGCASPLLEWHHFDPPWREQEHHDPDGMIALCPECHRAAESGVIPIETLRVWKEAKYSPDRVSHKFKWFCKNGLMRVCGNYLVQGASLVTSGSESVLGIRTDDAGYLNAYLRLSDKDGKPQIEIADNTLNIFDNFTGDIETKVSSHSLVVRHKPRDLQFKFNLRSLDREQFLELLRTDFSEGGDEPSPAHLQLRSATQGMQPSDRVSVFDVESLNGFIRGRSIKLEDGWLVIDDEAHAKGSVVWGKFALLGIPPPESGSVG